MRPLYYVLDERGRPKAEPDVLVWARWMEESRAAGICRTDHTVVGPWDVSTVFLGMEHNFGAAGPAVLWETLPFWRVKSPLTLGGRTTHVHLSLDRFQRRYSSLGAAKRGHHAVVDALASSLAAARNRIQESQREEPQA